MRSRPACPGAASYPRAIGLLELRRAISEWCERRFGVAVDSEYELIPTFGSKEAIFTFAQIVDLRAPKNLVLVADPAYPVPERGARFAGAEVVHLPLLERNGFLPDLAAVIEEDLEESRAGLGELPQQSRPEPSPRSPSTSSWRRWPLSTTSCSARTRPTARSTSTSARPRRCRCPTAETSSSSTRSASAPR